MSNFFILGFDLSPVHEPDALNLIFQAVLNKLGSAEWAFPFLRWKELFWVLRLDGQRHWPSESHHRMPPPCPLHTISPSLVTNCHLNSEWCLSLPSLLLPQPFLPENLERGSWRCLIHLNWINGSCRAEQATEELGLEKIWES